jgi:hypothetical protein
MTGTLEGMSSMPKDAKKTATPAEAERAAVRELVKAARARGEDLTGPDGLLKSITKQVLESALEEEMTEHLGHEKHATATGEGGNIRNGTRPKTVLTDAAGEVTIEVPGTGPAPSTRSSSRSGSGASRTSTRSRSPCTPRD